MGNHNAVAQRADLAELAHLQHELAALEAMTVAELAAKHRELFGTPTRSRNRQYLINHLAWRMQERETGSLSPLALERIAQLAPEAPARWQEPLPKRDPSPASAAPRAPDPRVPPVGTTITRIYEGIVHRVKVLERGFEFEGSLHRSLSGIARQITGRSWNGYVFFLGRDQGAAESESEAAPEVHAEVSR